VHWGPKHSMQLLLQPAAEPCPPLSLCSLKKCFEIDDQPLLLAPAPPGGFYRGQQLQDGGVLLFWPLVGRWA
jgi:hypothetical protein